MSLHCPRCRWDGIRAREGDAEVTKCLAFLMRKSEHGHRPNLRLRWEILHNDIRARRLTRFWVYAAMDPDDGTAGKKHPAPSVSR